MATRIYDDKIYYGYMSSSSDGEWFKVSFDEDGLANFWINSAGLSNDIDLYVYEEESTSSTRLGRSTESPGTGEPDDIIREIPVRAGRDYFVYVKNYDGGSCNFQVKAKNYPQDIGGDKEFDYGIRSVDADKSQPFTIGEQVEFTVEVKNYEYEVGPRYKVVLQDKDGNELDYDSEPALDGKEINNAYVSTTVEPEHLNNNGQAEYRFVIKLRDSGWEDTDENDNVEIERFDIETDGVKIGDTGSEVRGIQEMLLDLGYLNSPSQVDGDFGTITLSAVKEFQADMFLPVTGIVDSNTRGRLADSTRQLRQSIAYAITETGLFKDLKIQAYMIEDKEYTVYNTPQLTVKAKFSMFPTQGTSDFSLDMTNTNSASGTLYSGALSADGSINITQGKIKTALDTIGVKIGSIQGGDLRIKLVNNPNPYEFTMLLEYCKTIAGHNVYQILEMTFRNINQYSTQTAPVYATEMKTTFEVDKEEVLLGIAVVLLIGMIVVGSGGTLGPIAGPAAAIAMSL